MMKKQMGFTLIELMIVCAIIGILAAIAIPDFLKFTGKSRQAEARTMLGSIYVAQMSYYGTAGFFAGKDDAEGHDAFQLIGFSVKSELVARYSYLMDEAVIEGQDMPAALPDTPESTEKGFTAFAIGNIDKDAFIDIWAINDKKILRNQVATETGWTDDGNDNAN